jgi:hypothetical protein
MGKDIGSQAIARRLDDQSKPSSLGQSPVV